MTNIFTITGVVEEPKAPQQTGSVTTVRIAAPRPGPKGDDFHEFYTLKAFGPSGRALAAAVKGQAIEADFTLRNGKYTNREGVEIRCLDMVVMDDPAAVRLQPIAGRQAPAGGYGGRAPTRGYTPPTRGYAAGSGVPGGWGGAGYSPPRGGPDADPGAGTIGSEDIPF